MLCCTMALPWRAKLLHQCYHSNYFAGKLGLFDDKPSYRDDIVACSARQHVRVLYSLGLSGQVRFLPTHDRWQADNCKNINIGTSSALYSVSVVQSLGSNYVVSISCGFVVELRVIYNKSTTNQHHIYLLWNNLKCNNNKIKTNGGRLPDKPSANFTGCF